MALFLLEELPQLWTMKVLTAQEDSLAERLFGWWYRIAAPPEVPDEAPLRTRMRVRSGKITSVVFLVEIFLALATLIGNITSGDYRIVPAPALVLIVVVIGTTLNHKGKTILAGILIIVIEEMAILGSCFLVDKAVNPGVIINFYFFIAPELIAAEMIAPWVTLPVTLGNCLITIAMITFMPKTPDVLRELHSFTLFVYTSPVIMQIAVSVVCFLWVSSTYKEMKRANNAEEVSKLMMAMSAQQQAVQEEKQQLETSIQQIIQVHIQAANGNLTARVPLDQQNVLWPVAGSLNNLLARLQRWRYDALQHQQDQRALQQLLHQVQVARGQGKPLQLYATGTSVDPLILEIANWTATTQQASQ